MFEFFLLTILFLVFVHFNCYRDRGATLRLGGGGGGEGTVSDTIWGGGGGEHKTNFLSNSL